MRHTLRRIRLEKGISQTFMAKKIGFKTTSGYNNIEMGRNGVSIEQAKIISDILGEPIEKIFFEENLHETGK